MLNREPEHMLAMKCMASRISEGSTDRGDVADIRFLIRHLRLKTPDEALEIIGHYYPPNQVPIRAQFLIEDIFSESGEGS